MSEMQLGRTNMQPPVYEHFEIVKDALLEVVCEPDAYARTLPDDDNGLFIKIERLYADMDTSYDAVDILQTDCTELVPPLTVRLSGILRAFPGGNKMTVRYRELAHGLNTENTSVNHDYIFRTQDGEMVEFGQSIRGCPQIPELRQTLDECDEDMRLSDRGRKILQQDLGNQLEASAGDCDILFDRITQFLD